MIPNPWVILGIVLAWGASLVGVGWWQRHDGAAAERVTWQTKENAELAGANAKILALEEAARDTESKHAAEIAAIGEQHAKDTEALEDQHRRDADAIRAGALRLRVANACPARPAPSATAAPAAPASGGDDSTTGELPGAVTQHLLDLAADADRNTKQLAACQAVVQSYLSASGAAP